MNNRLIQVDMVLVLLVIALFFVGPGKLNDVITGATAAIFVISIVNHIKYYLTYKKFY